jgi:hypothetical protein
LTGRIDYLKSKLIQLNENIIEKTIERYPLELQFLLLVQPTVIALAR